MKLIITLFLIVLLLSACNRQQAIQDTKKAPPANTPVAPPNTPTETTSNFGVDDVFTNDGELTPPSFGE